MRDWASVEMQPALCPVHSTHSAHLSQERCCCKILNFPRYRRGVPLEKGPGFDHLVKDSRGFQTVSGSFSLHRVKLVLPGRAGVFPSRHNPHLPLHLPAMPPHPPQLLMGNTMPPQLCLLSLQPRRPFSAILAGTPPRSCPPALLDGTGGSALWA